MKLGETRMLDWRGVEIKVGDIVVYPVRQSSGIWMVEGRVEELHSMIEERWAGRDPRNEDIMLPTQVGGVTVTRLNASGWRGDDIKPDHRVKVGLDRLTVVQTAEEFEFERYSTGFSAGSDPIYTMDKDIEIDGRAS